MTTILHTARREKITPATQPAGFPASSVGRFVIRADGTGRFDRHFHDVDELWFVSSGSGVITIDDERIPVSTGDVIHTPAGTEHDIVAVSTELTVFWWTAPLTGNATGAHLHRSAELAVKHLIPVEQASHA